MVLRDRNICAAISGNDRWVGSRRSSAAVSADAPVHSRAGLHRAEQGCREALLDPGLAQNGGCLPGKHLGPAPVAARDRHQRSLAQRGREILRRAGSLPYPERILQGRIAAIEVTAKDTRDPLHERRCRRHEAPRREPAHRLVCVGAHLLGPAPAQHGPEQGSPRLGGRVAGPGRAGSPYCQRSARGRGTASARSRAMKGLSGGAVHTMGQPCVLVVDYAETRGELVGLLDDVAADQDGPDLAEGEA